MLTNAMAGVRSNKRMAKYIKVTGTKTSPMGKAYRGCKMDLYMREILKMDQKKDRVVSLNVVKRFMTDNGSMTNHMEKENKH